MFGGEERVSIRTKLSPDEFDEQLCQALEPLGEVHISRRGDLDIQAKSSLVSFLSTVSIGGRIKQTDDGYKVTIDYSVAPSPTCWVIGVLLFLCVFMVGGAIIFVPAIEKSNVTRAGENALRDLKEAATQDDPKLRRHSRD